MTEIIILGILAAAGVWIAVDALMPARPRLSAVLAALNTTASPIASPTGAPTPTGTTSAADHQLPSWLTRLLAPGLQAARRAGLPRPSTLRDLAVLARAPAAHLATQLAGGLAGLLLPSAFGILATAAGLTIGWQLPLWTSLIGAALGAALPQVSLHSEAARRRADLRHGLSALLDLVVIALAGGAGVEQALTDASRIGNSWAAGRLRAAIDTAAFARVAPWRTLGQLGADTGIPQLQELASAVLLAGGEGARVRDSLTARAATLRARQAAELKADAKAANQRMVFPLMLLGLGYLLFLLYPAIQAVKASL
jgi:tight adherence protein C